MFLTLGVLRGPYEYAGPICVICGAQSESAVVSAFNSVIRLYACQVSKASFVYPRQGGKEGEYCLPKNGWHTWPGHSTTPVLTHRDSKKVLKTVCYHSLTIWTSLKLHTIVLNINVIVDCKYKCEMLVGHCK